MGLQMRPQNLLTPPFPPHELKTVAISRFNMVNGSYKRELSKRGTENENMDRNVEI